SGSADPYFAKTTNGYKGSSGNIYNCLTQGFTGWGTHVGPNRQRFYCEALRCLGNGTPTAEPPTNDGGGLLIQGNDAVVGARSGFGSNFGTSLTVKDCSGVILQGLNVWESLARGKYGIACQIINMEGATITACKFNDTLSIETQDSPV